MIRKEEKVRMINKNLRKILGLTLSAVVAVGSFNVMPGCKKQVMTAKAASTLGDKTEYRKREIVNIDAIEKCNGTGRKDYEEGSSRLNTAERNYLWGDYEFSGKTNKYVCYDVSPIYSLTFTVGNQSWRGVLTAIDYGIVGKSYSENDDDLDTVYSIVGIQPEGELKSDVVTLPGEVEIELYNRQIKATCVEVAPYAFADENLTKVNIPDTYQRICDGAFADCTQLQSVQIVELKSDGVTVSRAGDGSSLHVLGDYAFAGCYSLKKPYLPDNLIKLGKIATRQEDCYDALGIDKRSQGSPYENQRGGSGYGKYYMGRGGFRDCYGIEKVELGNSDLKEVYIPERTFAGCTSLSTLDINKNVTKLVIKDSAFAGSKGGAGNKLTNLEFNCDVVLHSFAFSNCNNLRSVKFNKGFNNPDLMGYEIDSNIYKRYSNAYEDKEAGNFYGIFKDSFKKDTDAEIIIAPSKTANGNQIIIPNGFLENSNISEVKITEDGLDSENIKAMKDTKVEIDKYAFKNTVLKNFEINAKNVQLDRHSLYGINTENIKLSASNKIETKGEIFAAIFNKPRTEDNNYIKKITLDAPEVMFGYDKLGEGSTYVSNTFYGVGDNASLVFGENVKEVKGLDPTNTDNRVKFYDNLVLHNPLGNIKSVYITSPKTLVSESVLCDRSELDNCEDYKYTLYGYNDVPMLENGQETELNYADVAKKAKNITFEEYLVDMTAEQSKPIVIPAFQEDKIDDYLNVSAKFMDNTEKKIKYDASGKDGYCLNPEFFDKIQEYKKNPTEGGFEKVTVKYANKKITLDIWFVPKRITCFYVRPKKNKIFLVDTKVTPDDFDILEIVYNDDEVVPKLTGSEIVTTYCVESYKLKEGTNSIRVSVNGVDQFITVNAVPKAIVRLSAKQTNKEKFEGEKLENSDFEVTAYYNDGEETKDFKDFEILTKDALTTDTKSATIALKENDKVSTEVALADVKKLAPQYLNASYTGAGVVEGQEVKKSDIKVELHYPNNTSRVLKEDEYDLAYGKIVGGIENAVTIVYKADTTKKYVITVSGLKPAANGTTPKPSKAPTDNTTTAVPTVTPDTSKIPTVDTTATPVDTNANGAIATSTPAPTAPATEVPVPTAAVPNAQPILGKKKTAKVTLGSGEKITVKSASALQSYKTANREIATVSVKGIITAKKLGKTVITVTDKDNNTLKVTVTVKKAPKKVSVNFAKKTLKIKKKATIKVKFAKGYYSNKLTFTSSNKKIATVNAKGVITAKKKGTCKITAKTYNGKKAIVKMAVK